MAARRWSTSLLEPELVRPGSQAGRAIPGMRLLSQAEPCPTICPGLLWALEVE